NPLAEETARDHRLSSYAETGVGLVVERVGGNSPTDQESVSHQLQRDRVDVRLAGGEEVVELGVDLLVLGRRGFGHTLAVDAENGAAARKVELPVLGVDLDFP